MYNVHVPYYCIVRNFKGSNFAIYKILHHTLIFPLYELCMLESIFPLIGGGGSYVVPKVKNHLRYKVQYESDHTIKPYQYSTS